MEAGLNGYHNSLLSEASIQHYDPGNRPLSAGSQGNESWGGYAGGHETGDDNGVAAGRSGRRPERVEHGGRWLPQHSSSEGHRRDELPTRRTPSSGEWGLESGRGDPDGNSRHGRRD
ncbi:unnamed protein product, partial [Choristocarpus tenellus]